MSANLSTGRFSRQTGLESPRRHRHRYPWFNPKIAEPEETNNPGLSLGELRRLKNLGIKFAIDYGAGYSCLRYLKHVPIGFLKIARSSPGSGKTPRTRRTCRPPSTSHMPST